LIFTGYGNVKLNLPVSLNTGIDWITETAENRKENSLGANDTGPSSHSPPSPALFQSEFLEVFSPPLVQKAPATFLPQFFLRQASKLSTRR
jgi:hypothetical protein